MRARARPSSARRRRPAAGAREAAVEPREEVLRLALLRRRGAGDDDRVERRSTGPRAPGRCARERVPERRRPRARTRARARRRVARVVGSRRARGTPARSAGPRRPPRRSSGHPIERVRTTDPPASRRPADRARDALVDRAHEQHPDLLPSSSPGRAPGTRLRELSECRARRAPAVRGPRAVAISLAARRSAPEVRPLRVVDEPLPESPTPTRIPSTSATKTAGERRDVVAEVEHDKRV